MPCPALGCPGLRLPARHMLAPPFEHDHFHRPTWLPSTLIASLSIAVSCLLTTLLTPLGTQSLPLHLVTASSPVLLLAAALMEVFGL